MAEKKKKAKPKKKKASKKKKDYTYETGKRKRAVARAKVGPGNGKITINAKPLEVWGNDMLRLWIKEPLVIAGDAVNKLNFQIIVRGGGVIAQTEAARIVIARGLVTMSKDKKLKKKFLDYDRNLLVFDSRRTEPHKPSRSRKGGLCARAITS